MVQASNQNFYQQWKAQAPLSKDLKQVSPIIEWIVYTVESN